MPAHKNETHIYEMDTMADIKYLDEQREKLIEMEAASSTYLRDRDKDYISGLVSLKNIMFSRVPKKQQDGQEEVDIESYVMLSGSNQFDSGSSGKDQTFIVKRLNLTFNEKDC